jgi:hypothetical protein
MKKRHGGYVIVLEEGTHCLNENIMDTVDDVYIVGDTNPLAGVGFVNGGGVKFFSDPLLGGERRKLDHNIIGVPPYTVMLNGRKITVKGSGKDPDFSSLKACHKVTFFHVDGSSSDVEISAVCKNTITFSESFSLDASSGPVTQLNLGEGFVINPRVTLKTNLDILYLAPSDSLRMKGIYFLTNYVCLGLNATSKVELSNCVLPDSAQIFLTGDYHITGPNTYQGVVNLAPASRGVAYFQTFVSNPSRLVADGCAPSAWKFCTFASSTSPAKLFNGATVNFQGSHFVNNCLALYVADGSLATVYSCIFSSNTFGILAIYNSCITSRVSYYLSGFNRPPIFIFNIFPVVAEWGAYVLVPKCCLCDNVYAAIIDSRLYPTFDNVVAGQYGSENSLVLYTTNPSAIDQTSTGCLDPGQSSAFSAFSDNFLGIPGLQSTISPNVINSAQLPFANNLAGAVIFAPNNNSCSTPFNNFNAVNCANGNNCSGISTLTINNNNNRGPTNVVVINSNTIKIVPNARGSGIQQRAFINKFGPVPPDELIAFVGCNTCSDTGNV